MCARTHLFHQEYPKSFTFQYPLRALGHQSFIKKIQSLSHSSILHLRSDTFPSSIISKIFHIPVSSTCARTPVLHQENPKSITFQYPAFALGHISFVNNIQNLSHSIILYVRSDTSPSRKSKVYHFSVSYMCARTHFLKQENPKSFTFQYALCALGHQPFIKKIQSLSHSSILHVRSDTFPS